ncbi:uncharacterized protein Nmag_1561 [Natrialba magadii ATCC 43099]|uniref:CARDB domain-containing protein n=1 Tax=Natrialba magadii (strain ATCC 43099 / DSM 3394 / CCM 3739 / CIP 104546 / IAM 13178 / JCM 8861 / NBRC 102185 / NCIMB 2190 / MS3) TaxID=547559 RepID=D3SU79_NATMM|nr:hypothetical protein [Natrialba magadii]ADD05137.1 uncharacterized protein Nmag_1561 [Natrialba magadii ATCC 43099]ELY23175.1 hypothetical protein C500_20336 [Natrialba magadii ATCC 43099]
MTRPSRRRLLQGLTAGGITLGAVQWSDQTVQARWQPNTETDTDTTETDGSLSISITETNAPVPAGEYLQVEAELTNTGSTDVRTEAALVVGVGETEISRRGMTVGAGETETIRQGFYTYPVPQDDEFPVRIETPHGVAEQTVNVTAAEALPSARPDSELAVQPGTEVLFEAEALDPDESQTTIWWVDGESVTTGVGGAWEWQYYEEIGADFWWHEFEEPGSHEVTAAVIPDDEATGPGETAEETYAARWEIEVTDDGAASPSVEGVRPAENVVPIQEGDQVEFELEATDPDGGLDRVVWWLTQADTILDVTELEGDADTAVISMDGGCHTCHVVPWVICDDGTATALQSRWEIDAVGDGDDEDDEENGDDGDDTGQLGLSIQGTNSPVDAGDFLEVTASVTNDGAETRTASVELIVGHDPTGVDSETVTLEPGESETLTLGYETYETSQDEQFPVRVESGDSTAEASVQVFA